MYRNFQFLVKSATLVGFLLIPALILFFLSKNSSYFSTKNITLKHLVALILCFLLQLLSHVCTFVKKGVTIKEQ